MDSCEGSQQHLSQGIGKFSQPQRDEDMSRHEISSKIPDNMENLATSFHGPTSRPDGTNTVFGAKPNLLHDVQNLTGSPLKSYEESQRCRNTENQFSPRGYRHSSYGQDHLYDGEYFPPSMTSRHYSPHRFFGQPYEFSSRYTSSPRREPFSDIPPSCDIPMPASPHITHKREDDACNTSKKDDSSVKNNNRDPSEAKTSKQEKEKKSITTKTFAHGMMDVSLLTSNSTQLRAVLSNPDHEFYRLLLWLIGLSILLQVLSAVLLIMSDYFKTQVKEKDLQNQRKRKLLNFLSLALVTVVTSLNVLISAFSTPTYPKEMLQQRLKVDTPVFSSVDIPWGHNHTEL